MRETIFTQQIETDKGYHLKAHEILYKKTYIVSLSNFFLDRSFYSWNFTELVAQMINVNTDLKYNPPLIPDKVDQRKDIKKV